MFAFFFFFFLSSWRASIPLGARRVSRSAGLNNDNHDRYALILAEKLCVRRPLTTVEALETAVLLK